MVSRLAWVLFFGVASAAASQTPAPTPTPRGPEPLRSPGNADWAASWNDAKAKATKQQKLVFVEVDAPECGNCRRMDALLYPAMDFEALLLPMVPVKVNLQAGEGREIADRYGIRDTPAILITSPEGRIVFRMEGFTNAHDFYEHVHQDLQKYRAFAKKIDAQDIAHISAAEALATGTELYSRADPESALPRLRRVVTHPKSTAAQRDAARETLAAAELDMGQPAAARTVIEKLIATTKDPARKERAELFRAQLPMAENDPAAAAKLFRQFQKDHPNSAYKEQVNATLQKLADAGIQ